MKVTYPSHRPRLPTAAALKPYLEAIDGSRWYSNFGPLVERLESRLASHFGVEAEHVAVVANGTMGLTLALATATEARGLCLMPSWTFVATPHAALAAGLEPYFVDVDADTWSLTPEIAREALARLGARVAAVMPVAPFGAPFPARAWEEFHADTGVPVVIDAAAGFDTARVCALPTMISLHATKVFGIGEGGLMLSRDATLISSMKERSNFGFFGDRIARVQSWNAKASEYHAAVGLAALDEWPRVRTQVEEVAAHYVRRLAALPGIRVLPGYASEWVAGTCTFETTTVPSARLLAYFRDHGVDARSCWGKGCHTHPAFERFERDNLPTTELLANRTLSLPFYADLARADVDAIVDVMAAALAQGA